MCVYMYVFVYINIMYYYYYLLIYLLACLLPYLLIAIEFSLGGSNPYTSADKTNKNKYT